MPDNPHAHRERPSQRGFAGRRRCRRCFVANRCLIRMKEGGMGCCGWLVEIGVVAILGAVRCLGPSHHHTTTATKRTPTAGRCKKDSVGWGEEA